MRMTLTYALPDFKRPRFSGCGFAADTAKQQFELKARLVAAILA